MGRVAGGVVGSEVAPAGRRLVRRLVLSGSLLAAAVPAALATGPVAGASPALYSQTDFPGPFGTHSDSRYFGSQAADDFVVPAGQRWSVTAVDPVGVAGACGSIGQVDLTISQDASGVPGSVVYSSAVTTAGGLVQSGCSLSVPAVVTLDSGHYWLSIQSVGVSWGWQLRSAVSNDEAVWQLPSQSFFPDCVSWCGMDTALGTASGWDLDFSLAGTMAVPSPDLALVDTAQGVVVSGNQYSYTLAATNTGGDNATGVTVTDTLPGTVHFDSVSSTTGSCVRSAPKSPPRTKGGTISCDIGTLAAGDSATVTVVVTATTPGAVADSAGVTATNVTSDSDDGAAVGTVVQGD